jgi:hypothetical protein
MALLVTALIAAVAVMLAVVLEYLEPLGANILNSRLVSWLRTSGIDEDSWT